MRKPDKWIKIEWEAASETFMLDFFFETAPPGHERMSMALGSAELRELGKACMTAWAEHTPEERAPCPACGEKHPWTHSETEGLYCSKLMPEDSPAESANDHWDVCKCGCRFHLKDSPTGLCPDCRDKPVKTASKESKDDK